MKKFYILKVGKNLYIKELEETEYRIIQNFIDELNKPDFTMNNIIDSYTKFKPIAYNTKEEAVNVVIKELYDI